MMPRLAIGSEGRMEAEDAVLEEAADVEKVISSMQWETSACSSQSQSQSPFRFLYLVESLSHSTLVCCLE